MSDEARSTEADGPGPPMNLNNFFPHKVCINLDKRPDRWERIRARFARHGIGPVARFPALDGKTLPLPAGWSSHPGAYGCLRSHLAVVEQARARGKESVLIFEDDAVLDPLLGEKFPRYVGQLPADWDMLMFGGIHGLPLERAGENLLRIKYTLSTYAYALRRTIYDAFIELNRHATTVLDENTRELQKRFNCYCFMPHLAWVEDDYSDVRDESVNLWWLKESLILWGEEMERVLHSTAAVIFFDRGADPVALRNLRFVADYYRRMLPEVSLLVVEQGGGPALDPAGLPPGCGHLFLNDSGPGARGRAFDLGFEASPPGREFFVFLDADLFLTREDIKANLLKCVDYDFATSFREAHDLSERDTRRVLGDDLRWDYNGASRPRPKADLCDACCIFTRRGLGEIGGWGGGGDASRRVLRRLRIYHSPNPARRLFGGPVAPQNGASGRVG